MRGLWGKPARRLRSPTLVWAAIWLLATLVNGAIIISAQQLGQQSVVKVSFAIVAQLAATVALLGWLGPVNTQGLAAAGTTRRWWLTLTITLAVAVLSRPERLD